MLLNIKKWIYLSKKTVGRYGGCAAPLFWYSLAANAMREAIMGHGGGGQQVGSGGRQ